MMELPSLDFTLFTNGTPSQQKYLCDTLLAYCKNYGVAKIINCGIPNSAIDELLNWNRHFFQLPYDVKMKAPHPATPNPHRGYSGLGQERVSSVTFDAKESFDQGPTDDSLQPNIWIPEEDLPGFRTFMEGFFNLCCDAQLLILRALAVGLNMPEYTFDKLHSRHEFELRLTHYPAIDIKKLQTDTNRISEHHDWGTITLVFQDSTGGLEFEQKDRPGVFHAVESVKPMEIVLNVGDCLHRWTNGTLHSVNHRVKIPRSLSTQQQGLVPERHSVSFFCKPNRDEAVASWKVFQSDALARYEDITSYEYNQRLLKTTY